MKAPRWMAAGLLVFGGVAAGSTPTAPVSHELTLPQSDYIEQCGGCHGLQGTSAPAEIPVLRERVGYYMCLPEGRSYLLRLPNVAHSRITDDAELADLMNFVAFGLGGASVPASAKPFTAEEVTRERPHAMSTESLIAARSAIVGKLIRRCGAPVSLRLFFPGQKVVAVR